MLLNKYCVVCLAVDLNYKYTQFKKRKECNDALVSGMRSGLKGGCTVHLLQTVKLKF